ncbi:MAG: alpha/beta hydrolase [Sphingobacteriaceae bacterium]|jgi:pimeloyl-ACP methyl ester carboxylesterase|nr:alpha/beta hydrolase [Sphingobacteriaceae bacterium]
MKKFAGTLILIASMLISKAFSQELPPEGHFYAATDQVKIYYEDIGKGYPILLLHGFTGTGKNWKGSALFSSLSKAGYRMIIPDLRGNGLSEHPHSDEGYLDEIETKDLISLMKELNIKEYNVVGYSRGSIVGSKLMTMDPRVKKLVMGGMGDSYTNKVWPKRLRTYAALMGDTSVHEMDATVKRLTTSGADKIALAYQQKYQPVTTPAELAKVKIPVLIIRGTEDQENGSETVLQTYIPGSKLVYTPGTHGTASKTQQFADAVIGFFK